MNKVFRFFDVKNKNKIRYSEMLNGFDMLSLNLAKNDLEKVWSLLDLEGKHYLTLNDFLVLQELSNRDQDNPCILNDIER